MTAPVATCTGCRVSFTAIEYRRLPTPLRGTDMDSGLEPFVLELRNHSCGSTLAAARLGSLLLTEAEWEVVQARCERSAA